MTDPKGNLERCPECGDLIMSDYFEEEFMAWCGGCGKDLTEEVYATQVTEDDYDNQEDWTDDEMSEAERMLEDDSLSRLGREKV